jgi:hypothetical protein
VPLALEVTLTQLTVDVADHSHGVEILKVPVLAVAGALALRGESARAHAFAAW